MAATLCVRFLPKQGRAPLSQAVRHGSRAVTRHRKPLHILKQKLMAVTRYVPPPRAAPLDAYPKEAVARRQDTPLTLLLQQKVRTLFEESKMVAVVQNNNSGAEDMILFKHRLHKHGISVQLFPNQVLRSFVRDSVYCNLAPLLLGPTVLLASPELRVREMLRCLRSSPGMTLLGGCVENRLLSAQGLAAVARLPAAAAVQGQLVGGLSAMTGGTAAALQQHPARLAALLQQYVRQRAEQEEAAAP